MPKTQTNNKIDKSKKNRKCVCEEEEEEEEEEGREEEEEEEEEEEHYKQMVLPLLKHWPIKHCFVAKYEVFTSLTWLWRYIFIIRDSNYYTNVIIWYKDKRW